MSAESDQVICTPSGDAVAEAPAAAPAPAATTTSSETEKPKAVFVENLSPNVTTKMLNEFFSLCGGIESITMRPKPNAEDGTLEAIVFFESSSAADTAVLLTNAILVDRNISITYFNGADAKTVDDTADAAAAAEGNNGQSPSVWASILAAGYMIGDNIQSAALAVDEKYGVRKGFTESVDKIDQTLGLSAKATAFSNAVHQKSEEYHVNEKIDALSAKMTEAGQSMGRAATNAYESAVQNPYVSSALSTLSGWGSAIVAQWTALTDEASALYAQQTGKPVAPAAAAVGADAAAPAPAAAEAAAATPEGPASQPAENPDEVKIPKAEGENAQQ